MKRTRCNIIDTYNDFSAYWTKATSKTADQQVTLWQTSYMKKYPELLRKQIQNYEEMNLNWQDIARKVLRRVPSRLPLMQEARDNLLRICEPVYSRAVKRLHLDFDTTFVIYVGIGCGAGWATKYGNRPAVLLGLENIAEEKWHKKNRVEGLVSHEVGHLAHMESRGEWKTFDKAADDPLFRLYIEGFAQRCEEIILQKQTWHFTPSNDWLNWCKQQRGWLAYEFLERLERQASVRDFFGSWFSIKGKKQTGYFLGHAFIRHLEETYSLAEIAVFNRREISELSLQYLKLIRKEETR